MDEERGRRLGLRAGKGATVLVIGFGVYLVAGIVGQTVLLGNTPAQPFGTPLDALVGLGVMLATLVVFWVASLGVGWLVEKAGRRWGL